MPEQLDPSTQTLRDTCVEFAQQYLLHNHSQQEIRAQSKALGIFQMTQPESHGGKPASTLALTVARETLASFNPPSMDGVFGPQPRRTRRGGRTVEVIAPFTAAGR